jgi:ATP synthase protein I
LQQIDRYCMIRVMPNADSQRDNARGNYARFFGLGFTLILMFGLPTVVGFFLDRLAGTLPLFLLVGLAAGFVGGMIYVYRALQNLGGG